MAEPYVVAHALNLSVYGQVQRDFTLGGVPGFTLGEAAVQTAYRRATTYETELTAMNAAAQLRIRKLEELGNAMSIVSGASTKFKKDNSSGINQEISYDYKNLDEICAKYGVTIEGGGTIPHGETKTSYANLQKLQSTLKLALDEEQNALQRHSSTMQSVMSKRDSAMQQLTRVSKKIEATARTTIANIGKGV